MSTRSTRLHTVPRTVVFDLPLLGYVDSFTLRFVCLCGGWLRPVAQPCGLGPFPALCSPLV